MLSTQTKESNVACRLKNGVDHILGGTTYLGANLGDLAVFVAVEYVTCVKLAVVLVRANERVARRSRAGLAPHAQLIVGERNAECNAGLRIRPCVQHLLKLGGDRARETLDNTITVQISVIRVLGRLRKIDGVGNEGER